MNLSPEPIRVKIISDGTDMGTSVVDEATGRPIANVIGVRVSIDVGRPVTALIEVVNVPADVQHALAQQTERTA